MLRYVFEPTLRATLTGVASFFPFSAVVNDFARRIAFSKSPQRSPDFGALVLEQRLSDIPEVGYSLADKVYLEIGPGLFFSSPIAAALMGARQAIGIDAYDYTDFSENANVLAALSEKWDYDVGRVHEIKDDLQKFSGTRNSRFLSYYAPWKQDDIQPETVDLITSISTLEHVQDPDGLYESAQRWMRTGGYFINRIDFTSHGMTKNWYGHLVTPTRLWTIIQGKKQTHLNRWTEQMHVKAGERVGLKLLTRNSDKPYKPAPEPFEDVPKAVTHVWKKMASPKDRRFEDQ